MSLSLFALSFGIVGFADDYIKVVKKRNLGLTIKQKTALQIVLMVGYLLTLFINDPTGATFIPFVGMVETKFFFWVIGFAVIYATTNAVNFTDGVDGLCGSVTLTAALSFIPDFPRCTPSAHQRDPAAILSLPSLSLLKSLQRLLCSIPGDIKAAHAHFFHFIPQLAQIVKAPLVLIVS